MAGDHCDRQARFRNDLPAPALALIGFDSHAENTLACRLGEEGNAEGQPGPIALIRVLPDQPATHDLEGVTLLIGREQDRSVIITEAVNADYRVVVGSHLQCPHGLYCDRRVLRNCQVR
ncbi:MAG: hypothetical protein KC416_00455 [Myxococcales bacterium]|nr:hypothetical protein [Myxococcales bacterium]